MADLIQRAANWREVDFTAYAAGAYSPPPELCALPDADFILAGWGGGPDPMNVERDRQYVERGLDRAVSVKAG